MLWCVQLKSESMCMWESMCDIKQKGSFLYCWKKNHSPHRNGIQTILLYPSHSDNSLYLYLSWEKTCYLLSITEITRQKTKAPDDSSSWNHWQARKMESGTKEYRMCHGTLTKKAGILHMHVSEVYLVVVLLREPTFLNTSKGDIKDTSDSREGSRQALL